MAVCLGAVVGCSRGPQVQSDLPIKRVVVYRNGVAYFERAGHVDGDDVRFKMRQTEVGDFLATLAVMEQGGSSVRSATFPLKDETGKPKDADADSKDTALRTVVLSMDGRAHDLQVGYIAAAPVWRPSYRLVVQPSGQADLQAWGIVENLSGEDWTGIQLSLVAGAPVAFEARLGTPVIPERPVVTDSGEVIAAVPHSETSLDDRDSDGIPDKNDAEDQKSGKKTVTTESPAPPPPPAPPAVAAGPRGKAAPEDAREDATGGLAKGEEGTMGNNRPAPEPKPGVQPSQPRNVRSLASIAVQGGATKYVIPNAITIPDKNATMVMLFAKRVAGEASFLFAPDDGVPGSNVHPFRVARFQNQTEGMLERGPIAVFHEGAFLGQGLVDPLAIGGWATVPFALESAIGIDSHQKSDMQGTRVAKIENGNLFIERDLVLKTFYDVENGGQTQAKLLVKHPRRSDARLFQPPQGTEDNVGTGSALVPVVVPAHAKQELVVDERAAETQYADWFGAAADNAVKLYLADRRADPKVVQQLTALWPLRSEIVTRQDQRNKVQNELGMLNSEAYQKRADLRAIEKNRAADALRRQLTARIAAIATRTDTLTTQNITLGQELGDLQAKWRDGINAVKLAEAPPVKD
jgi:hypothetical protein